MPDLLSNIDNATATDYIELIEHIKEVILDKDGVQLETEVKIIGEDHPAVIESNDTLIKKATSSFKAKLKTIMPLTEEN